MNPILSRLLSNKHTLIAGIVYAVLAELIPSIGAIWFPQHADQFKATTDKLKEFALIYGLAMSGESSKSLKSGDPVTITQTGDTVMISKPQT